MEVEASYLGMDRDPTYDGYDHDVFSLGVTFSLPLYQGGFRKADVAEAMVRHRQATLSNEELKRQIAVDVARAFYQARSQARTITALNDRLVSARENYDAVAKRFAYGLADSLDVIDANTLLKTAEQQAFFGPLRPSAGAHQFETGPGYVFGGDGAPQGLLDCISRRRRPHGGAF